MKATHAEFEKALRVVAEGKAVHGLYAFEDAVAVVKSLSRFYWRQLTFGLASTGVSFLAVMQTGVPLPWLIFAALALSIALTLVAHKTPLNRMFAPRGFSAQDVGDAYHQLMRPA